jgi:multiple sugar transport system permease protein
MRRAWLFNSAANGLLVVFGILMIAPIYWVLVTSVLPPDQRYQLPPRWIPTTLDFSSFGRVFTLIPFGGMFLNSLKVTGLITLGALTTSVLAAYAFARLRFPGRDLLFIVFLAGLMVPQQITVIPVFVLMRSFQLVDTHAALVLPALVNALGIFLLRQFFMSIPKELDEAAKIDGAGHLTILFRVIIPLSWPAISALTIFLFQAYWNDFFWPNVFLSSTDQLTLPLGLVALQGAQGEAEVVVVFAAVSLLVAPLLILFLFFQKNLIESIASTGLKG